MSEHAGTAEGTLRAWAAANVAGDMGAWRNLVTDRFTYTHSNSNHESAAEVIEAFNRGRSYRSWDVEQVHEERYSGCAVLTGTASLGVTREGQPASLHVRFTATAVEQDGEWRLAAFQTTRLPD